ncbi:hypothetical protein QQP08_026962 [Theobroma cacao]|nr:hypothetical protein QQP08_026962 [Theobroma cacao]
MQSSMTCYGLKYTTAAVNYCSSLSFRFWHPLVADKEISQPLGIYGCLNVFMILLLNAIHDEEFMGLILEGLIERVP